MTDSRPAIQSAPGQLDFSFYTSANKKSVINFDVDNFAHLSSPESRMKALDLIAIYETRRQRRMMYVEGAAVTRVTIAISSRLGY